MMDQAIPARLVSLPYNVPGLSALDEDGEPMIYLNARHTREQNLRAFGHELRHISRDDFFNNCPIEQVEGAVPPALAVPPEPPAPPSYAEQFEAIYRRGEALYGLKKDAWVWIYLFEMWLNRDSKLKYTTIPSHVFNMYGKVRLGVMLNRIFKEYFVSIGRES